MNRIINEENYSFEALKHIYDNYELRKDYDNNIFAVNLNTKEYTYNEKIIDKIKFSNLWFLSTMYNRSRTTTNNIITKDDYEYAFNDGAKYTYLNMMNIIKQQLENKDNINPVEVLKNIENNNYKHSKDIINYLLGNKYSYEIVDKWSRYAVLNSNKKEKVLCKKK